jgi:hypothetical protein
MSGPIKHTASLPLGYVATFTWMSERKTMSVLWEPAEPRINSPRHHRRFMRADEQARREFVQLVATSINAEVLITDLRGRTDYVTPAAKH